MSKASILPQTRDNFKLDSLINRPQNIGKITQEEAHSQNANLFTYHYGSCDSGLAIKFYMAINQENRVIECKIEVFGESELIAVASIAALVIKNKTPDEILNLKEKGLEYFLRENPNKPAFSPSKRFLTVVMTDALRCAAKKLKGEEIQEGDIVDSFTKASERFIKESIKEYDIKTLKDLIDYTRAGAYDKSCQYPGAGENLSKHYLTDILKATREEMEQASKNIDISNKPFKEMSIEEKKAAINAIIDKHIRHMLIMDGGDMEILDIKNSGEHTDIYIRYLGACSGCASASTGTLFAIEGILKQKLDDKIRVIPL